MKIQNSSRESVLRREKALEGVPIHIMSETKEPKSNVSGAYKQAREAFEDLKVEEKAIFLVEAAVHTIARGMEEGFRALATEVNGWFEHEEKHADSGDAETEPAEETVDVEVEVVEEKPAPPKKTTKRSTSRRSTTSRRTTKKKTDTDSDTSEDNAKA